MNTTGNPAAQPADGDGTTSSASAGCSDEQRSKPEGKWELFIDYGLRGGAELRKHLGVGEKMFTYTAGQAAADPRAFVLYAAIDEVQKAACHLMRFQEVMSDEDVSPLADIESRLVDSAIIEELGARQRRLVEVLTNLVLFSTTNEQLYYRHFLMLEELEEMLHANDDLHEFHGATSINLAWSISQQASWIAAEQAQIDFNRTWYLQDKTKPIPTGSIDSKKLKGHVRLSKMKSRLCRAIVAMTPNEKLCSGTTYADAYGEPSAAVHFSLNSKCWRAHPHRATSLTHKLGLTIVVTLVRIAQLMDKADTPIVGQLLRVLERGDTGSTRATLEAVTKGSIDVGDFVLAYGDLAEVLKVCDSKYGNRSYRVLYLAERPLKEVPEDWFPARSIRLILKRSEALVRLKALWDEHKWPIERLQEVSGAPLEKAQGELRAAIIKTWPLLKQHLRRAQ